MKRRQKRIAAITTIITALVLVAGCGVWYVKNTNKSEEVTINTANSNDELFNAGNNSESDTVAEEEINVNLMSSEELFQAFCDGKITAEARSYYDDTTWTMDNTYLQFVDSTPEDELDVTMQVEKKEPVDLDNDGELEFILENPVYGDMCFDCKDGKVVCFAQGDGTTAICSYTQYDGAYWIVHSDTTHGGRCTYELSKYDGDLKVVDSLNFGWEDWEDTGVKTYYMGDQEISETEYEELYKKVFGEN
ncbi:MAG: hypothetical protein IKW81_12685 [Pseudobutyrivibrio sp.]|nr:hypothetical protein [Pseudobutyrivibrio sp.]